MDKRELLEEVISLKPSDRFVIVEGILKSLDKPNLIIDEIWIDESERRLEAYRSGILKGVPAESVFTAV